jgi:hypothetical protein
VRKEVAIALAAFSLLLSLDYYAYGESELSRKAPSDQCRKDPKVLLQRTYAGYQVKITQFADWTCSSIDIERKEKLLYHDEEIGGHYFLGSEWQKGIRPLEHLTGKRDLNLIVSKWTGGAHCCFSLHIFKLNGAFAEAGHIEGGNYYPIIKNRGNRGSPRIDLSDDFLSYQFSSFAFSATGEVILKYAGNKYEVAGELMKKPPPSLSSFARKIPLWRKELRKRESPDWPPPDLIQAVTDLVFTGNKKVAWELLDRSWPPDASGKQEFLHSYEEALGESRYYKDFERQL